jgi:hypothetical protein
MLEDDTARFITGTGWGDGSAVGSGIGVVPVVNPVPESLVPSKFSSVLQAVSASITSRTKKLLGNTGLNN